MNSGNPGQSVNTFESLRRRGSGTGPAEGFFGGKDPAGRFRRTPIRNSVKAREPSGAAHFDTFFSAWRWACSFFRHSSALSVHAPGIVELHQPLEAFVRNPRL